MNVNSNNRPFAPAAWPFFYGWAILGFGTIGLVSSAPGQTIGVSTFTDHLIAAVGISRDTLSLAYMCGTVGSALLLTHAGKLYDRFGARRVGVATCLALGGVLVALSQCDRIVAVIGGATGVESDWLPFGVMLLAFFALRFSGQGVLAMTSRNMMLKWFERHRGLAIGISGVVVSLGFSLTPRIFEGMIDLWTWRGAWLVTGAFVGLGVSALALIFFRDNPEDCGLRPDGEPPEGDDDPARRPKVHPVRQYTLAEARRSYSFWVFTFAIAMFGLYVTGLTFHVTSIFEHAGMDEDAAVAIFLPASVISVVVRLAAGWISDHVRLKYLLVVQLAGLVCSMLGVVYLAAGWTVWLVIAGNGVCMAMVGLLSGMAWPRFFGREHLGAISGLAMAITVLFSAIGPYLFSKSLVWTGAYAPAAWVCLGATALLLLGSPRANNPQRGLKGSTGDGRTG